MWKTKKEAEKRYSSAPPVMESPIKMVEMDTPVNGGSYESSG